LFLTASPGFRRKWGDWIGFRRQREREMKKMNAGLVKGIYHLVSFIIFSCID
jgi:hypothetical protein